MPTPYSWGDTLAATASSNAVINALLAGTKWASTQLTYSFPSLNNSKWSDHSTKGYGATNTAGEPWLAGYAALQSTQTDDIQAALQGWSNVTKLKFTQTSDNSTTVGDLRFAFSSNSAIPQSAQAWAYYPADATYSGDVWFSREGSNYSEASWSRGSYEYMAAIHEIGHALGLKHPFDDTPPPTLRPSLDSRSYTVMSYSSFGGQEGSYFSYEPTTPMVIDIMAIQHLYGKSNYAYGNNTYFFDERNEYNKTIWDAGGIDTIVYEARWGSIIDLREGYNYGSRMGQKLTAYDASGGVIRESVNNIWIAFGTVIENVKGGEGNDKIYGNDVNNVLNGRDGHDHLSGGAGNDKLEGGTDNDRLFGGAGRDKLYGNEGNDRFVCGSALGYSNVDLIMDFELGRDVIQLDNAAFTKFTKLGDLGGEFFKANSAGKAMDSNDYIVYETDTGKLFYDADGSGAGVKVQFATVGVSTHASLRALDFDIV